MNYNRGCKYQPNFAPYQQGKKYADFHKAPLCDVRQAPSERSGMPMHQSEMNYKLGMVYSPVQEWQNIYPSDKVLEVGTIFEELNKPFLGYKSNKGGCNI